MMDTLRKMSDYGLFLLGLSIMFSLALFVFAWFARGAK